MKAILWVIGTVALAWALFVTFVAINLLFVRPF